MQECPIAAANRRGSAPRGRPPGSHRPGWLRVESGWRPPVLCRQQMPGYGGWQKAIGDRKSPLMDFRLYRSEDASGILALVAAALGPGSGFDRCPAFWRWWLDLRRPSTPVGAPTVAFLDRPGISPEQCAASCRSARADPLRAAASTNRRGHLAAPAVGIGGQRARRRCDRLGDPRQLTWNSMLLCGFLPVPERHGGALTCLVPGGGLQAELLHQWRLSLGDLELF